MNVTCLPNTLVLSFSKEAGVNIVGVNFNVLMLYQEFVSQLLTVCKIEVFNIKPLCFMLYPLPYCRKMSPTSCLEDKTGTVMPL